MKFNHFCLLAGVVLIVLSLSVFANAACGVIDVRSSCSSFIDNIFAHDFLDRSCPNGILHCPFISNCHEPPQSPCCTSTSPNSVCCPTTTNPNPCGCYTLPPNCSIDPPIIPPVNNCTTNLAPIINEIPNQTINYTENFSLDLWDYIDDYDDFPNELKISITVSGHSISCVLDSDSNRFLTCNPTHSLGSSIITISAKDKCKKIGSTQFNVNVTNSPPHIFIPNQSISYIQSTTKLLDLYDYSSDENKYSLTYEILSQSNPYFANCYIDANHFISCALTSPNTGLTDINVKITDIFELTAQTTFRLTIMNNTPVWQSVPLTCINESKTKFIDLRNYVSDLEDKNNLTFRLSQTSVEGLSCSLVDSNFVSCTLNSNKKLSVVLDLNAVDSKGASAKTSTTISSNCFDGNGNDSNSNTGLIIFQAETYSVCLESCSTYALPIYLKNDTNAKKCFDFDSESSPYNYLNTSVSSGEICLNPKEETNITLSVNSCGAEERKYNVDVFDKDSNLSLRFKFEVGTCSNFDEFRIEEFDGTICQGEKKDVSVLVKNTSSASKKIYLSADNEMVLPHFSEEYVTLNAGEQKVVQLTINAIALTSGTTELVSLSGDAGSYHIEKDLYFDVVDCSGIVKRTFTLSAPNVCFDVKRGQTLESQFSIRRESNTGDNCSLIRKEFFFNISGASSVLSYNTVSLKEGEGKTILYSLIIPTDISAGRNYVTINASDGENWDSFTQSKEVCLNVLPESKSSFFVRTQSKDIIWCGSNVFEVEIVNNGDLDENYLLSSIQTPIGVNVSFSEDRFIVKKGTSKIIYVSVSTNTSAKVEDNQKIQLKLIGSTQLTATIYFNVKEKTTFDDLQILSATSEINMSGNSSAPFDLVIRNNSEFTLKNVIVLIESLPSGVTINDINIASLASGELINVSGVITADSDVNGEFAPVFVVSSGQLVNKKSFVLNIEKNNGIFAGMFSAFFSFGPNSMEFGGIFGLIILAIILIVLVWLITLGAALVTTPEQKEVWME